MNGAAELIRAGENGFVLSTPQSVGSLARAMSFFLERGRCVTAGQLAAKTAHDFSKQDHVKQIAATLAEIAARHSCAVNVSEVEPGLFVNQSLLSLLQRHGLNSYAALAEPRGARRIEYNRGKVIHRVELEWEGRPLTFYLKRHVSRLSWFDWCRRATGRRVSTPGNREWNNLLALHAGRMPAITPVAAGARLSPQGYRESFVMTQGLDEHIALDQYIGQRFVAPLDARRRKEKHRLIAALSRLTRQLHWSGFNHRDYYLCHLFVRPGDGEDLRIIDLERVGYRMPLRARWIIKDLAALNYSSLALPLTNWDRLRFYALYSRGQPRQKRRHRLLRLRRKSVSIARHDQKLRYSNQEGNWRDQSLDSVSPGKMR
jgi:heptose I phosphotransferase